MIIPEVINNYNVYDSKAKMLIGISGEVELPSLEAITDTIEAAGILGVTGLISTNRTAYPFCFSFHKHSNINFSSIGLSCLALRIGKSWFAPCNVIV